MANHCLVKHSPQPPHEHPEHPDMESRKKVRNRLKIAFLVCVTLMLVEFGGAFFSKSLALFGDAAHMTADCFSLGVTLLASWLAERLHSQSRSYGYYRLETLAALANGFLLLAMAVFIVIEAVQRFFTTQHINSPVMLTIGTLGLIANIVMLWVMAPAHEHNLNLKGAFLHVMGDALSSVAVIIGATFIFFSGQSWPDTVASLFVAVMISTMAVRLSWASIHVLLEGTPTHMDPKEIENFIQTEFPTVKNIHDFHIWEITSRLFAMTAHLEAQVESIREVDELIDGLNAVIRDRYGIGHTTFQVEPYKAVADKS